MEDLQSLLAIERFAEDAFRVKKTYVDMTGDLLSASSSVKSFYWHLPSKDGLRSSGSRRKASWLAKGRRRGELVDRDPHTPKQFDRAIKILVEKGFIETSCSSSTDHRWSISISPGTCHRFRFSPKVKIHFNQR